MKKILSEEYSKLKFGMGYKMKKKSTTPKIKRIMIAVGILFTIILGLLFSSYLFVHSYIQQMNLVETQEDTLPTFSTTDTVSKVVAEEVFGIEPEPEVNSQIPDSSKEDIVAVEDKIQENLEENSTPIIDSKDVFNILLIGSDTRESNDRGRSDAMIIISLNDKTKTITAISIMRDIYLQIPGKKDNRINASYQFGGANLLIETIEQNFKIKIDCYASVDFYAFVDTVDTVGGVTMDLSEKEIPFIEGDMKQVDKTTGQINIIKERSKIQSGTYYLDGIQALNYARIRHTGNSDFDRTGRQRKILEQIFLNVKDLSLSELNQMLKVILPQITTNLSEKEILYLILSLPKLSGYDLRQCRIPLDGTYSSLTIRGMSVLGIDFEENNDELHKVIYGDPDN